jgi:hypothetical protein
MAADENGAKPGSRKVPGPGPLGSGRQATALMRPQLASTLVTALTLCESAYGIVVNTVPTKAMLYTHVTDIGRNLDNITSRMPMHTVRFHSAPPAHTLSSRAVSSSTPQPYYGT